MASSKNISLANCSSLFDKPPVSLLRPPRHHYQQLPSPRHIRLIEVLENPFGEFPRCHLEPCLFEEAPPYQALSYTWGDGKAVHTISLDGTCFGVTSNLHDFLSRFRWTRGPRYIWIDAICINQNDNHEKGTQIQMMGDIYHRAWNVVVWLGEAADAVEAIHLVRSLAQRMGNTSPFWLVHPFIRLVKFLTRGFQAVAPESLQSRAIALMDPAMRFFVKHQTSVPWWLIMRLITPISTAKQLFLRLLPESKYIGPEWSALIKLMRHPWHERVWVIQEVVFATSITIMYGSEQISWAEFQLVVEGLCSTWMPKEISTLTSAEKKFAQRSLPSEMIHIRQVGNMKSIESNSGIKQSLLDLLFRFSRCKSTVRRDKVFALMGLSHEAERDRMLFGGMLRLCPSLPTTIDYEKSDRDVFTEIAQNMLTREASAFRMPLDILPFSGIGHPNMEMRVANLPSWAPDWSCVPPAYTLAYHIGGEVYSYRASGKHSDPYVYNGPEGKALTLAATGIPVESQNLLGMMPGQTTSPYISIGPTRDSLVIKATAVGEVAHLGSTWDVDLENMDPSSCLLESILWRRDTVDLALKRAADPYPTGEVIPEAIWRTLIGNRTPNERPAPQLYQEHANTLEVIQQILKRRLTKNEFVGEVAKSLGQSYPDAMFGESIEEQILDSFSLPYATALSQCSLYRRFCVTNNGYMGLIPPGSQNGDLVCIIQGAQTPYVLRASMSGSSTAYRIVGECYVHGMMDGEMSEEEMNHVIIV
ncbi:Heterokaryon incompatibility protein 6 OR allele [Lachnellula suecica]|uniref:Heterokaryon incompatibility protein 6 OR allele n=1 Tax=Lachnellula suecica TaxID=602035 RepID=A0A8T9CIN8_9HELO|nr:Heterokaryon incompatibility protein 6 OR allele [Lachnellula suecica]